MKNIKYLLFLFALNVCLSAQAEISYSRELEEIFSKLDNMILQREEYRLKKEERIKMLRNRMDMRASLEERFHINKVLYDEYYVYNADSAMLYVTDNLRIASLLKRKDWEYTWKINKSFLLSATGLLKEAEDELKDIPVQKLSDNAKVDYRILVLPDHPTPIWCRTHTSDPVPFMLYDSGAERKAINTYNEKSAKASGLVIPEGYKLIDRLFSI